MADASPQDRIDAALARIAAAVHRRDSNNIALAQRHEALRKRVSDAIGAIDSLLEDEGAR